MTRIGQAEIRPWEPGTVITPGVWEGIPNDVYHSLPGISKSGLDRIRRSPAHYRYAPPRQSTRAMEIGSAIHAAILEPQLFEATYKVLAGVKSRVEAPYKAAIKAVPSEFVLTEPEGAKVLGMQQACYDDEHIRRYLAAAGPGRTELTLIAGDVDKPEEWRRIRLDAYIRNGEHHIVLDLKKTQDARVDAFERSVTAYRYHVQAAWYARVFAEVTGESIAGFVFAAIEEEAPHGCAMYVLDDETQAVGLREANADYARYLECLCSDKWPAYESKPVTIGLTSWAMKKAREHTEGEDE